MGRALRGHHCPDNRKSEKENPEERLKQSDGRASRWCRPPLPYDLFIFLKDVLIYVIKNIVSRIAHRKPFVGRSRTALTVARRLASPSITAVSGNFFQICKFPTEPAYLANPFTTDRTLGIAGDQLLVLDPDLLATMPEYVVYGRMAELGHSRTSTTTSGRAASASRRLCDGGSRCLGFRRLRRVERPCSA